MIRARNFHTSFCWFNHKYIELASGLSTWAMDPMGHLHCHGHHTETTWKLHDLEQMQGPPNAILWIKNLNTLLENTKMACCGCASQYMGWSNWQYYINDNRAFMSPKPKNVGSGINQSRPIVNHWGLAAGSFQVDLYKITTNSGWMYHKYTAYLYHFPSQRSHNYANKVWGMQL